MAESSRLVFSWAKIMHQCVHHGMSEGWKVSPAKGSLRWSQEVLYLLMLCSFRKTELGISEGWRWFQLLLLRGGCSGGQPSVGCWMGIDGAEDAAPGFRWEEECGERA